MLSASIQVGEEDIFGYGLFQDPGSYVELGEKRERVSLLPFFQLLHSIQLPASSHLHLYCLIYVIFVKPLACFSRAQTWEQWGQRRYKTGWGPVHTSATLGSAKSRSARSGLQG